MAIHSVWGDATPPGALVKQTDGSPSVEVGQMFYFEPDLVGGQIVGARLHVPADAEPLPSTVTAKLYLGTQKSVAAASKTVSFTASPGGWIDILFDTPIPAPTFAEYSGVYSLGITFGNGIYYANQTARSGGGPVRSSTLNNLWWSHWDSNYNLESAWYRIPHDSGSTTPTAGLNTSYGIDSLVSDASVEPPQNTNPTANAGADQSVLTGSFVTLNGSGSSDSDGTIASYSWSQSAGPSVTLSGTGATRTFTPTASGTYIFSLTVTDDDGAQSSSDSVTVVVSENSETAPIVAENANDAGVIPQSQWFDGLAQGTIEGFPRSTYYVPGDTAQFSVDHDSDFTIQVNRLGYYGGNGARTVYEGSGTGVNQPAPEIIPNSNGAVSCSSWSVNASWTIPANATPGWYQIIWRDAGSYGFSLFCVSDALSKQPVLVVGSDTTWHCAYNGYGGNNVYGASQAIGNITQRAHASTYDKPVITLTHVPQTHFFNGEYATLRYLERIGVEVGYTTHEQIEANPSIMDGRDLIVFSGHNEYVSTQLMSKTKSLIASGQNVLNLAANDFFWRIKHGTTDRDSASRGRVMWCHKDTMSGPGAHASGTPFSTMAAWQGTWQDSRYTSRQPSWEFLGDRFIANGIRSDEVKVPFDMKSLPVWRNCLGVQNLSAGQEFSFGSGSAGMEWDMPWGTLQSVSLSKSTVNLEDNSADLNGETYLNDGVFDHAIQIVQASPSSGVIVNFNTTQWGWTLDDLHVRGSNISSNEARQATLNIIYDLGATADFNSIEQALLVVPQPVLDIQTAYGLSFEEEPPDEEPVGQGEVHAALVAAGYTPYILVRL